MTFTHIHCSSRFDRSAEALESDIDDWMEQSSLITMTELNEQSRASRLMEKGWSYANAKGSGAQSNSAVAWNREMWRKKKQWIRKLTDRSAGGGANDATRKILPVWSCTVLLHRVDTNRDLLVSVAHLPASTMGHASTTWSHEYDNWRVRKESYQQSMRAWSTHVHALLRINKPEAAMAVADWNWNLKDDWFRDYLHQHWGEDWRLGWRQFPTGGSLAGPGHGSIIDGTLALNLKLENPADMMPAVRSSDHKPYKESWDFLQGQAPDQHAPATGHTKPGKAWWGFQDYNDSTLYDLDRQYENE